MPPDPTRPAVARTQQASTVILPKWNPFTKKGKEEIKATWHESSTERKFGLAALAVGATVGTVIAAPWIGAGALAVAVTSGLILAGTMGVQAIWGLWDDKRAAKDTKALAESMHKTTKVIAHAVADNRARIDNLRWRQDTVPRIRAPSPPEAGTTEERLGPDRPTKTDPKTEGKGYREWSRKRKGGRNGWWE